MPDPPDPSVKPPLFNAVLAYMKFLMLSRDRAYLQEAIIARFSLDDLINAHKVISSQCIVNLTQSIVREGRTRQEDVRK